MRIQVNTGRDVEGGEALAETVETAVRSALDRFEGRLTRIEVHLDDADGEKSGRGDDKRCLLEARPEGMQPVVVTGFGDTPEHACHEAARKMQSVLSRTFDRREGHHSRETIRQNESS